MTAVSYILCIIGAVSLTLSLMRLFEYLEEKGRR